MLKLFVRTRANGLDIRLEMAKKLKLIIFILSFGLCLPCLIFGETIILKSGKKIKGEIIEKTDAHIKIDVYGVKVTYYWEDIQSIDNETVDSRLEATGSDVGGTGYLTKKWEEFQKNNEYVKAIAYFKEALQANPDNTEICNYIALAYDILNQFDEAVAFYEKVLEIEPLNPTANFNIANIYIQENQPQKAIPYFERAIQINPKDAEACLALAQAYCDSNQYNEAVPYFEQALQLNRENLQSDPENVDINFTIGFCYASLGDPQAIPYFEKVIELVPERADVYAGLGKLYEMMNEFQKARKYWLEAKELFQKQGDSSNVEMIENDLRNLPY